jgi:hypothetical protein
LFCLLHLSSSCFISTVLCFLLCLLHLSSSCFYFHCSLFLVLSPALILVLFLFPLFSVSCFVSCTYPHAVFISTVLCFLFCLLHFSSYCFYFLCSLFLVLSSVRCFYLLCSLFLFPAIVLMLFLFPLFSVSCFVPCTYPHTTISPCLFLVSCTHPRDHRSSLYSFSCFLQSHTFIILSPPLCYLCSFFSPLLFSLGAIFLYRPLSSLLLSSNNKLFPATFSPWSPLSSFSLQPFLS